MRSYDPTPTDQTGLTDEALQAELVAMEKKLAEGIHLSPDEFNKLHTLDKARIQREAQTHEAVYAL